MFKENDWLHPRIRRCAWKPHFNSATALQTDSRASSQEVATDHTLGWLTEKSSTLSPLRQLRASHRTTTLAFTCEPASIKYCSRAGALVQETRITHGGRPWARCFLRNSRIQLSAVLWVLTEAPVRSSSCCLSCEDESLKALWSHQMR